VEADIESVKVTSLGAEASTGDKVLKTNPPTEDRLDNDLHSPS
jgi:hypothetical protein